MSYFRDSIFSSVDAVFYIVRMNLHDSYSCVYLTTRVHICVAVIRECEWSNIRTERDIDTKWTLDQRAYRYREQRI
jgi:hypothetical protein